MKLILTLDGVDIDLKHAFQNKSSFISEISKVEVFNMNVVSSSYEGFLSCYKYSIGYKRFTTLSWDKISLRLRMDNLSDIKEVKLRIDEDTLDLYSNVNLIKMLDEDYNMHSIYHIEGFEVFVNKYDNYISFIFNKYR